MATKVHAKESEVLEKWRTSLENATAQTEVAAAMAELGYTPEVVATGKAIFVKTRTAYDVNRKESDETIAANKIFIQESETLDTMYTSHRKKAKFVFRNDSSAARELDVHVAKPDTYLPWMESVKKFYNNLSENEALCVGLATFKVTAADITAAKLQIEKVEKARAEYVRELGESKDAVAAKDAAFAEAEKWMRDFYTVARIALEDHPQLFATLFK
jgi:hypothetical protein